MQTCRTFRRAGTTTGSLSCSRSASSRYDSDAHASRRAVPRDLTTPPPPPYLAEPQFSPGVDGVQALFIAFQLASNILFGSKACKEGRLSFWGIEALGLPLHVTYEDALRAAG